MFEARLQQAQLLKKVLESIKDLVTDANFDCSATGFSLQVGLCLDRGQELGGMIAKMD